MGYTYKNGRLSVGQKKIVGNDVKMISVTLSLSTDRSYINNQTGRSGTVFVSHAENYLLSA